MSPIHKNDCFACERESIQCFSGIHFSSAFYHLLLCHLPFFSLLGSPLFHLTLNGWILHIVFSTQPVHAPTSLQQLQEPLQMHFIQERSHQSISTKRYTSNHKDLAFHLFQEFLDACSNFFKSPKLQILWGTLGICSWLPQCPEQ